MTSADVMALKSAALPFVMPWKDLDPHFEVVSLDAATEGWNILLAGQGIRLRSGSDDVPEGCSVATGFERLDALTPDALGIWASKVVHAFRPGGLLVLGGTNPEHNETCKDGLFAAEAAQIIKKSGFARVRVIHPASTSDDTSLFSALYGMGSKYVIIAQTQAYGKPFDVFSTVFADTPTFSAEDRFRYAEAALHHRIEHGQASLHDRVTHAEAALHDRITHAEVVLHDQSCEITELHAAIARLEHATRRRGLRKLAHKLRQKWRARRRTDDVHPLSSATVADSSTTAAPDQGVVPTTELGRETSIHPSDPVPLSSREITIYTRLFGNQAE